MSLLKAATLLFMLASLNACIGIETGLVGDKREAYIRSIKPALASWQKNGASDVEAMRASFECGGCNCDHGANIGPEEVIKGREPGESFEQTYWRLNFEWDRCMMRKGFKYIGACRADYAKVAPGCGAP